jgi:hypothetical protein
MKITEDSSRTSELSNKAISEEEALQRGMVERNNESIAGGAEVYAKA